MDSRRGFFASIISLAAPKGKGEAPCRPLLPGFVVENAHKCVTCTSSACKNVCEENIVVREEGSAAPYLDFSRRGCTFCGECQRACEYDCFVAEPVHKIDGEIRIGILSCLAWNKTICRSCADVCNDKAIQFSGLWNPEINSNACTACGFCIGVCPAYSISVHPLKENG
jgi:ferredoxin-type protein NapF